MMMCSAKKKPLILTSMIAAALAVLFVMSLQFTDAAPDSDRRPGGYIHVEKDVYHVPVSKKLRKKDENRSLYPVISLVLYFGTKRKWNKNRSLKEVLTIPPEFEPYVNDYRIHVVNVAFLERHQIDRFKSDFWFVADYFWQLRNKKEYKPNENSIIV